MKKLFLLVLLLLFKYFRLFHEQVKAIEVQIY